MDRSTMARLLGRRGGLARGRRLSPDARKQIAGSGGVARRRSLEAARRIVANLRYAAAVNELRGGSPAVTRRRLPAGPLPGLYRDRP